MTWQQVNRRFQNEYSCVLTLLDLLQTILTPSTASDRSFSHMMLIKPAKRTLMIEESISNSLTIKLEGLIIHNLDQLLAVNLWFNKVPIRPGTSGFKAKKADAMAASNMVISDDKVTEEEMEKEVDGQEPLVEAPVPHIVAIQLTLLKLYTKCRTARLY